MQDEEGKTGREGGVRKSSVTGWRGRGREITCKRVVSVKWKRTLTLFTRPHARTNTLNTLQIHTNKSDPFSFLPCPAYLLLDIKTPTPERLLKHHNTRGRA